MPDPIPEDNTRRSLAELQASYGTTPDGKSAWHVALGKLGGSRPKKSPSGFAANRERAVAAGKVGGKNRWRGKASKPTKPKGQA